MATATLKELRDENQRLRAILNGLTRVGLGKAALIEIHQKSKTKIQLIVCRADVDEMKFLECCRAALGLVAAAMGGDFSTAELFQTGVVAEDAEPDQP